jgi:hypothetical protein
VSTTKRVPATYPSAGRTAPPPASPLEFIGDLAWCLVLAFAPYLWRWSLGTRDLPNDDAWAYERIFDTLYRTGELVMVDWNDINLVGMFVPTRLWVEVVGHGSLQVNVLGSVMGLVSLLALRSLLRTIGAPHVRFALGCFGVYMGFVATTGTFMADQFALAGVLVSLAAAVAVAERAGVDRSWRYGLVGVATVAALFAFTVRQQSVIGAAVVFGVLVVVGRQRVPLGWLGFGVVYGLLGGSFMVWRAGVPDGGSAILGLHPASIVSGWAVMAAMLTLAVTPMLVRRLGRAVIAPLPVHALASVLGAAFGLLVSPAERINDSLSVWLWIARGDLGIRVVAAVVLANLVVVVATGLSSLRLPHHDPFLVALSGGTALSLAGDIGIVMLGNDYYSRYSLTTVALAIATLAVVPVRPRESRDVEPMPWVAWTVLGAVAATSYWTLDRDVATIAVTEAAAEVAACAGIPADEFDGGFVWMGTHYDGVSVPRYHDEPFIEDGLPPTWHHRIFPETTRRAVALAESPDNGDWVVAGPVADSGWLPGTTSERWIVVRPEDASALEACLAGS